jgi:hypothetical protein
MPCPFNGGEHAGLTRIRRHVTEDRHGNFCEGETRQHIIKHAQASNARVGDDQYTTRAAFTAQIGKALRGAGFAENLRRSGKTERQHVSDSLFL